MLLCNQEKRGVRLNAEQAEWEVILMMSMHDKGIGRHYNVTWHNFKRDTVESLDMIKSHQVLGLWRLVQRYDYHQKFSSRSQTSPNLNLLMAKATSSQPWFMAASDPRFHKCFKNGLEQDSLSPGPQSQENVPQVAETVTTSNELELLYSPMFSELLNGTSHVVHSLPEYPPPLNIHSTHQLQREYQPVTAPGDIIKQETNTEKNATFDDDEIYSTSSVQPFTVLMKDYWSQQAPERGMMNSLTSWTELQCLQQKPKYVSLSACCAQVLMVENKSQIYAFTLIKYLCHCDSRQPYPSRAIQSSIPVQAHRCQLSFIKETDTVMSDSEDSTVTYTAVSSPFGGLSDIGSLGVDGPPLMPEDPYAYVVAAFQAPPSPDYVSGPEYPPSPDFVPEPVYPEFMPPEDEVLPAKEQPLPAVVSPTADSPGYVPESDPEEDPEEEDDDDEDPEEDPVDYPADEGDDGDDDEDDDVDIQGDEEEDEHPAPADSIAVALPAVDHAPSAEETEPFEIDESTATPPPHHAYRVTARISIRDEPPTSFWSDTEVARLLAIPTPPPSPLSLWSSPLSQIPSPPLPVSPPLPASPTYPLGYRAAMIRLRAEAPSTSYSPPPHIILSHTREDTPPSGTPPLGTPPLLHIPAPTSSPSLLPPSADHGADRLEVCLPPRKRLCFALGPRYEVRERSSAAAARPNGGFRVDYGFVATKDREIRRDLERDVGYGITDTWDEILARHIRDLYETDDEQTKRQLMAGRLNMLYRDSRAHACTALLIEREARMSREAWGRSMDASDLARSEVMSLRTTVLGQ
ncbi:hypothetical protein Tco_1505929 [Tanacetum coccineum]